MALWKFVEEEYAVSAAVCCEVLVGGGRKVQKTNLFHQHFLEQHQHHIVEQVIQALLIPPLLPLALPPPS